MPNFHPLVVHFPIALLTLYALMELLRVKRLMNWEPWFYIKAVFVILGGLSTLDAIASGLLILSEFAINAQTTAVLTRHAQFAYATSGLFLLIAILYALAWRDRVKSNAWTKRATRIVRHGGMAALAFVGLGLITMTGALGGGFVHGPNVDPVVNTIFTLLGL